MKVAHWSFCRRAGLGARRRAPRSPRRSTTRAPADTEIKDRQYHALCGPASGLCRDRQDRGRLLQQDQMPMAASTAARSPSSPMTTAIPRPRRWSRRAAWSKSDQVLLIFQSLGTPSNSAIRPYLNDKKVPQLFPASGATKWADPQHFPWTMGWQPNYQSEGPHLRPVSARSHADGKIAVLYQNDDYGKDLLKGVTDGLGDKASMIVAQASYEVSDPTVDSQMVQLHSSGANVLITIATPKFAAQSIKKVAELAGSRKHIIANVATSVGGVLEPAGLAQRQGPSLDAYLKEPTDSQWQTGLGSFKHGRPSWTSTIPMATRRTT